MTFEFATLGNPINSYPYYNLVELNEDHYAIELAAAGFSSDEFDIELERNVLTISAKKETPGVEPVYLHRGIATRSFVRRYRLASNVEVGQVTFADGILSIELIRVVPDEEKPKKIKIASTNTKQFLTE